MNRFQKKLFFVRKNIKQHGKKLFVRNSKFERFFIVIDNVINAYSGCNYVAMQEHRMDIPSIIKRRLEKSTPATDSTHLINKEILCLTVNNNDHIIGIVRNNIDALKICGYVMLCIIHLLREG